MHNLLTVDLEDWFSVEVLSAAIPPEKWPDQESVVCRNTYKILEIFERHQVHATFFVLGWIAKRYPDLINDVVRAGHEIACHSFYHRMVLTLTPDEFRADTAMAIDAIQEAIGQPPRGYRSPSWGMTRNLTWAYDILGDLGFEYDSSVYPIRHDIYGDPEAPSTAYEVEVSSGKKLIEIPASTITVMGKRMALGGGGWLRQFPYWFTRWGIRKLNAAGVPAMIYFHPWELDTNLPESSFVQTMTSKNRSVKNWLRQYKNVITMETKVEKLLKDFDFMTLREYIYSLRNERKVKP
jgi:polysaccharide deacetylase family protein (PEP-CTERM system associated)